MTVFGTILFFAILIGLFIFIYSNTFGPYDELSFKIIISPLILLFSLIADGLVFLILLAISYSEPKALAESRKEIPIYSLGGNTSFSVHGAFVLGTGVIDGTTTPSYRYYELVNGKYHLDEIPAGNFDIVCTNSVEPKIVIDATMEKTYPKLTWIFKEAFSTEIDKDKLTGTIYIPEGSIIQSYEIKL